MQHHVRHYGTGQKLCIKGKFIQQASRCRSIASTDLAESERPSYPGIVYETAKQVIASAF
jgi:hypothetical protein